ncbi:DUF2207 domain-containing protein [Cloacibacillus evryensis]|uniref:DUF2207 domain-containing protein n=1 Tax=Cloacibacillus evryensis TaxID=508460 RepID=UPI00241E038B|nr:DUF2207 domain-containing protein [Cloacibacillus evryensis]
MTVRSVKKIFIYIAIAVAAVSAAIMAARPCMAGEVITAFHSDIRIERDGSLIVTEEIRVNIEHKKIRNGLTRSFPVRYKDRDGKTVSTEFNVEEVRLDGRPVRWSQKEEENFSTLRLGSPETPAPMGEHTYTIRYKAVGQIGFFTDHDELYWNVTGNDSIFPILRAYCTVTLPGMEPDTGFKSIEWYTGARGDKGGGARSFGGGSVETTKPLKIKEGLSVVYTWRKGLITPPAPQNDFAMTRVLIAAVTLILTAAWLCFVWFACGVTPRRTAVPLFDPPKGATAPFLRYARDLSTDSVALSSTIMGLAVKKALRIEEEDEPGLLADGKKYTLYRRANHRAKLAPEEQIVMDSLFSGPRGGKRSIEVSVKESERLEGAVSAMEAYFDGQKSRYSSPNIIQCLPVILFYVLGTIALGLFGEKISILIVLTVTGIASSAGWIAEGDGGGAADTKMQICTHWISALIPTGCVLLCMYIGLKIAPGIYETVIMTAALTLTILLRPLIFARTEEGAELLAKIEGLAMYMDTAERGRLEMFAGEPEDTPEVFEKMLPYALALDCAETWGDRFAAVLARADYKPEWFCGAFPRLFFDGGGLNDMAASLSREIKASLPESTPGSTSSASGGRGFSGCGRGGGGCGGW